MYKKVRYVMRRNAFKVVVVQEKVHFVDVAS